MTRELYDLVGALARAQAAAVAWGETPITDGEEAEAHIDEIKKLIRTAGRLAEKLRDT